MLSLAELNSPQRAAVDQIDGPLLVLAGAGTGKTKVITYRIANMLGSGITAENIAALTFTNKAAVEMKTRIRQLMRSQTMIQGLHVGTFHSFCLRILREFGPEIGLPARFGIAPSADQWDLMTRTLRDLRADRMVVPADALAAVGWAKARLVPDDKPGKTADLAQRLTTSGCPLEPDLMMQLLTSYRRHLSLNRVIDFDDCIYLTVRLLENHSAVRSSCQDRWTHLMVDEFQDTNSSQLRVLELLAVNHGNVCVVGDDDQSIYSWRGAEYTVVRQFEKVFAGAQTIKLEQNYRCPQVVLDAANHVIRRNSRRKDKKLWSQKEGPQKIELMAHSDEDAERSWVAEKCMGFLGRGRQPHEIAVLYRANALATGFELSLREAGIPHRTFGGQSFFDRKEVRDYCAYLRLVLAPADRLALWRCLTVPHRGIGLRSLEKIDQTAVAKRCSPWQVISSQDLPLTGKQATSCREFVDLIQQLRAMPRSQPEDFLRFGEALRTKSGLWEMIKKEDDSGKRQSRLSHLRLLPEWLARMAQECADAPESPTKSQESLDRALLDRLSLDSRPSEEKEQNESSVSLMTIHSAKGLEFPIVIVAGIEEDLLPHKNCQQNLSAIEEERRLFYVAMTRAKESLHLSYACARGQGSRQQSRFVKEIPEKLLTGTWEQDLRARKETRRAGTRAILGRLKKDLRLQTPQSPT